jgi:hypothetical protein
MCPIFNGFEDTAVLNWHVQIRFLSVGMDEKRSLQRSSKHKRRIGRSHYEFINQEHQDDLRRATPTVAKRVEKCIEVDGGIFEHLNCCNLLRPFT